MSWQHGAAAKAWLCFDTKGTGCRVERQGLLCSSIGQHHMHVDTISVVKMLRVGSLGLCNALGQQYEVPDIYMYRQ